VPATDAPSAPAASTTKPAPAPASSAPAETSPAPASAPPKRSSGSADVQSSASSTAAATLTAFYSTTVGGKNYSGSVQESGGTYVASVGNLPGVSASGSSIQAAENNLSARIDALV
jgi:hypothetical protein